MLLGCAVGCAAAVSGATVAAAAAAAVVVVAGAAAAAAVIVVELTILLVVYFPTVYKTIVAFNISKRRDGHQLSYTGILVGNNGGV